MTNPPLFQYNQPNFKSDKLYNYSGHQYKVNAQNQCKNFICNVKDTSSGSLQHPYGPQNYPTMPTSAKLKEINRMASSAGNVKLNIIEESRPDFISELNTQGKLDNTTFERMRTRIIEYITSSNTSKYFQNILRMTDKDLISKIYLEVRKNFKFR